ncbi:MAG: DNA cytosine methyltransferase [Thermoplasmata archaeon]|nr:MAG: DNA cytosine methyltransferase [Thermoplasmata archaeon]
MKKNVLNLYAGIGGNRKLWADVDVTAVEINPKIAKIYQDFFPDDTVVIGDAHQYLLEHYDDGWDFIWSSPPCQSHSSFRKNICVRYGGTKPVYPDMSLWQEILFLKYHAECYWVVENVKPYYKPLIDGIVLQRHMFWANFEIIDKKFDNDNIRIIQIPELQNKHGFDLSKYEIKNKRQILRNCVYPQLGKHVFDCAFKTNSD